MKRAALLLAATSIAWGVNCGGTSVGFTPFSNPYPPTYKGQPVSLYPNGSNQRPAAHEALGLQQAAQVMPRDAAGNPDPNGRIVLLSIGLSNTTQEFSAFMQLAAADAQRNPRVVLVDGAFGGWTAAMVAAQPDQYWSMVMDRLRAANVSANQVQAAWLKLADANPTAVFPADARQLQSEEETVVLQTRPRFPNLTMIYFASRIYAGYTDVPLNPEPYAYQTGFAVKWLIEQQINGAPELDVAGGRAPWLAWGPYLWADGAKPRFDGLAWACSDLGPDGTHPSDAGRLKVARMLLDFFHSDSTARTWYLAQQPQPAPSIGAVTNAAGYGAMLATGSAGTIFGSNLANATAQATSFPLPHELAGTRVDIDGVPALLYFVSPGQINFVVPPTGGQSLVVVRGGTPSAAVKAPFTFWAPGLFTLNGLPDGPVAAVHLDASVVSSMNPARPGETIEVFGTGMGIINPALLIPIALPIVQIGGRMTQTSYAGPAPGLPGLTQINVVIPQDAPAGTAPIFFQLAGASSNTASVAIAAQ